MGVAGSGKSTIGRKLAARLACPFQEGDDLHTRTNIAKMAAGVPLTDEDRAPWLEAIARAIDAWILAGSAGVVSCSALKRAYRAVIIGERPGVRLVYLKGDRQVLATRLAGRQGHFMPPALLDSQLQTLEEPAAAENPIIIDIGKSPPAQVDDIVAAIP
jgi:carbohydrate kinase (thermoresistant glucokinase family)